MECLANNKKAVDFFLNAPVNIRIWNKWYKIIVFLIKCILWPLRRHGIFDIIAKVNDEL